MHFDRSRFLLLTATIAGGGCSAPSGDTPNNPQNVAVEDPTTPPDPPTETTSVTEDPGTVATQTPTATATPTPSGPCASNDTGDVPACDLKAPAGHCEGFSSTKSMCKGFRSTLRPTIAARAVTCLNQSSSTQALCDWDTARTCFAAAVRTACGEPSVKSECSNVMSYCSGQTWSKISDRDCEALLSATKPGKRASMVSCMMEGCGIDDCAWQLM